VRVLRLVLTAALLPVTPADGPVRLALGRELELVAGRSIVIDSPAEIARISTSDPTIADAVPATTREFLVHGKGAGVATLVVWTKDGERSVYNVTVAPNVEPLRRLLKESFPGADIRVQSLRDEVTLTGRVANKETAERAAQLAAPLARTVVNNLEVAPPPVSEQILLRVRFAELNKSVGESLAVNLVSLGAGGTLGRTTTGQFSPPNVIPENGPARVTITDALNIFAFRPDLDLMAFIRALQTQGVLQILAEPNLVTTSGKEASFVVGGEFPVPVVQGGANVGAVTIIFREFGVRLTFNPQVTDHGTIKLYVRPEVSTLDFANALTISGFTVPALATRRVETHIELARGQSFAIGGLIDDRVTENLSRIPGFAAVPVLGALFKSRSENRAKTELVVLVTPEIARPLEPGDIPPSPAFPKPFLPAILEPVSPGAPDRKAGRGPVRGRRPAPSSLAAVAWAGLRSGRDSGLSAIPASATVAGLAAGERQLAHGVRGQADRPLAAIAPGK